MKHYICNNHNLKYNSYCNKCNQNLCQICEKEHQKEKDLVFFREIMPHINDKKNKETKMKIECFNNNIKGIIKMLNSIIDTTSLFYKIYSDIIDNFDKNNINFQILNNINEISSYKNIILNDIDTIMNEINNDNKINSLMNLYNQLNEKNKNIIKYKINKKEELNVKIFGNKFVNNNVENCKILYKNKEYDLMEYFDISQCQIDKDILELELKIIKNLTDMSNMFEGCSSLIYLSNFNLKTNEVSNMSYIFKDCTSLSSLPPDISKWDTSKVSDMSGMFYNCINLSNLPDISKWNINNVNYLSGIFYNCSSLLNVPDISKWDTTNVNT
jgi:surface protein